MRGAQVPQMGARHHANAHHGEQHLVKTVPDGERCRHQRQTQRAERERRGSTMAQESRAQGDDTNPHGQSQADAVEVWRKQHAAAQAKKGDKHKPEYAMHHAQAGKKDAGTIEPIANQGEGAAHLC
jgi:hypothetical protein